MALSSLQLKRLDIWQVVGQHQYLLVPSRCHQNGPNRSMTALCQGNYAYSLCLPIAVFFPSCFAVWHTSQILTSLLTEAVIPSQCMSGEAGWSSFPSQNEKEHLFAVWLFLWWLVGKLHTTEAGLEETSWLTPVVVGKRSNPQQLLEFWVSQLLLIFSQFIC